MQSVIENMAKRIARVSGYSSSKDEMVNPALKDATEAFRHYKPKGRCKPMKPKLLDYVALSLIVLGFVAIFSGFFFGGILLPVGIFLELASNCIMNT
jgi:hypothetical protein